MVTIYDLLEVSENASKGEIENAYQKMIVRYQTNPNLSDKENKDNEFILNKLKMAYEILSNDEKRKRYDKDLAQKRAEDLLKNVTIKSEEQEESEEENETSEEKPRIIPNNNVVAKKTPQEIKNERYDAEFDDSIDEVGLTSEEQKKIKEAAKEEFQRNLKRVQQAEAEYNQAYEKAYKDYMKKESLNRILVPLKKLRNFLIVAIVTVIVAFIAWHIPPVKATFVNLYNENQIVKLIVDIISGMFRKK